MRWTRERGLRCMLRCRAPRVIRPYNLATGPSAEVVAAETPSQGHSLGPDRARFLSSAPRRRWRCRDCRPGRNSWHRAAQAKRLGKRKAQKAWNTKKIASVTRRWRREAAYWECISNNSSPVWAPEPLSDVDTRWLSGYSHNSTSAEALKNTTINQ
jgi:hypothetical protein